MLYICDISFKDMKTSIPRTQTAFRLSNELLKRLKIEARKQNRSLNNYVESILMASVNVIPNQETLASMKEACEDRNLDAINLNDLEGFIDSL